MVVSITVEFNILCISTIACLEDQLPLFSLLFSPSFSLPPILSLLFSPSYSLPPILSLLFSPSSSSFYIGQSIRLHTNQLVSTPPLYPTIPLPRPLNSTLRFYPSSPSSLSLLPLSLLLPPLSSPSSYNFIQAVSIHPMASYILHVFGRKGDTRVDVT